MSKNRWLLLAVAALSWLNGGTIWLIQFSCYPLWPDVGRSEFWNYHGVWWHSTWGVVFVPSIMAVAGSIFLLRLAPIELPRWSLWLGLTSGVSAKPAIRLHGYQPLMSTHWIRVALITAYGITSFYMLIKGATASHWSTS